MCTALHPESQPAASEKEHIPTPPIGRLVRMM